MTVNVDGPKIQLFNDGEALAFPDLNRISKTLTARAWEIPGYMDFFAWQPDSNSGDPNADIVGSGNTYLEKLAFTRGPSLSPRFSSLSVHWYPGAVGVYDGSGGPGASGETPHTKWAFLDGSGGTDFVTLAAAGVGAKRWDYVTIAITESDDDTTPVDFEDATTGAKTTQVLPASRTLKVTIDVVAGTPHPTAPTMPPLTSVPAGAHVLFAALVNNAAITEVRDMTVPAGPVQMHSPAPSVVGLYASGGGWGVLDGGRMGTTSSGAALILPAGPLAGDSLSRLMGLRMCHKLSGGGKVEVVAYAYSNGITGVTVLDDISALFPLDAAEHDTKASLMGGGASGGFTDFGPYWGGGYRGKSPYTARSDQALALRITSGASGDYVTSAQFWTAKG